MFGSLSVTYFFLSLTSEILCIYGTIIIRCTCIIIQTINYHVDIISGDPVITPHGSVSLLCTITTQTTGVQWLVNNTVIEDIDNINITTEFDLDTIGLPIGRLNLANVPLAYNETHITCMLASGLEEATVLLLIQG